MKTAKYKVAILAVVVSSFCHAAYSESVDKGPGDGLSVGKTAKTTTGSGIAIGDNALSQSENAIAIGNGAHNKNDGNGSTNNSIAIGQEAQIYGGSDNAIAIGHKARVHYFSQHAVAIGNESFTNINGVALGGAAKADKKESIAIGNKAFAGGEGAISIGSNTETGGIAVGKIINRLTGRLAVIITQPHRTILLSVPITKGAAAISPSEVRIN